MIDGHVRPRHLTAGAQFQRPIRDGKLGVARYDIYVVGLYRRAFARLHDRHRGDTPEDLGKAAFVSRIEVLDEYYRKARVGRQIGYQVPARLQPTGGSTDTNDRNRAHRSLLLIGRWLTIRSNALGFMVLVHGLGPCSSTPVARPFHHSLMTLSGRGSRNMGDSLEPKMVTVMSFRGNSNK